MKKQKGLIRNPNPRKQICAYGEEEDEEENKKNPKNGNVCSEGEKARLLHVPYIQGNGKKRDLEITYFDNLTSSDGLALFDI